jgi:hypothetical protein
MVSDRHLDTFSAFTLVAGVILVGVVLYYAAGALIAPWLLQRAFTDVPK